jgi:uncharacterized membrane-anchored protein
MYVLQRNPRPTKQPVLPSWCDYHSFSISKKIICIGVIRALLTLGVFIFCTVILAVVDGIPLGNQIFLGIIAAVNGTHFVVAGYFIYATKTGNCRIIKRWLIADIVLSIFFVISVVVVLCIIPVNKFNIIIGIKLMLLSVFLCFRNLRTYYKFLDEPLHVQNI